jgi:hypothetical protein
MKYRGPDRVVKRLVVCFVVALILVPLASARATADTMSLALSRSWVSPQQPKVQLTVSGSAPSSANFFVRWLPAGVYHCSTCAVLPAPSADCPQNSYGDQPETGTQLVGTPASGAVTRLPTTVTISPKEIYSDTRLYPIVGLKLCGYLEDERFGTIGNDGLVEWDYHVYATAETSIVLLTEAEGEAQEARERAATQTPAPVKRNPPRCSHGLVSVGLGGHATCWRSCPGVRGGALYKTLAVGVSCPVAQRVWHHFASSRGSRPRLPSGWRCSSRIIAFEESLTSCSRRSARLRFYES